MEATASAKPRQRKPIPREMNLLNAPAAQRWGAMLLTVGKERRGYLFREITCDIGGRAFEVVKVGTDETTYHVRLDGQQSTCECLGFLKHSHCKHLAAIAKLLDLGKLPGPAFRTFETPKAA